ncbi:MAG: hypothetical protein MHM6MM_000345 [Cercozoa sp. M6MM]
MQEQATRERAAAMAEKKVPVRVRDFLFAAPMPTMDMAMDDSGAPASLLLRSKYSLEGAVVLRDFQCAHTGAEALEQLTEACVRENADLEVLVLLHKFASERDRSISFALPMDTITQWTQRLQHGIFVSTQKAQDSRRSRRNQLTHGQTVRMATQKLLTQPASSPTVQDIFAHLKDETKEAGAPAKEPTKATGKVDRQTIVEQALDDDMPWLISPDDISLDKKLGRGMFGDVFLGELWGTRVAVKQLRDAAQSPRESNKETDARTRILTEVMAEVNVLQRLRHPNIVLYMAAQLEASPPAMVLEFCANGNLSDFLASPARTLDFTSMIRIMTGVARGMTYLHSLRRRVIHRDLKSENVFLDENLCAKIGDFGLSHLRSKAQQQSSVPRLTQEDSTPSESKESPEEHYGIWGTPEWMAPEVLQGRKYNEKVDVYSFGIVLSEIVSRALPYRDQAVIRGYEDVVTVVLDEDAVPSMPDWAGDELVDIMNACLQRSPRDRPSFNWILDQLQSLFGEENYADETLFRLFDLPRLHAYLSGDMDESFQPCQCFEEGKETTPPKPSSRFRYRLYALQELATEEHTAARKRMARFMAMDTDDLSAELVSLAGEILDTIEAADAEVEAVEDDEEEKQRFGTICEKSAHALSVLRDLARSRSDDVLHAMLDIIRWSPVLLREVHRYSKQSAGVAALERDIMESAVRQHVEQDEIEIDLAQELGLEEDASTADRMQDVATAAREELELLRTQLDELQRALRVKQALAQSASTSAARIREEYAD